MAEQYQQGHIFDSLAEGRAAMHDWMVRRGQTFEYFKTDNNRKFWDVRCSAHNTQKCKFRIRVQECKGGKGKLSVFIPHTCRPSTHNNNKQARKVNLLASNEYSIAAVKADPKVAVKLLQANEKQARGTNPPYYAEFRAKGQIRQKEYGDETESFRKIPALLLAMQGNARGERGCYFDLDVDPTFKRFKRCWILPMATEQAFRHCRNFIASDGTFCTGQYKMTLLIVSTLDGNGQIIPITWCLCCGENKKNWSWFLRGIKTFLLGMTDDDAVIISDRDKGLAGAVPKYFPYAAHGHCVFHIGQNVRNEHGTKLENIDPTRWVLYAFPRPRYGHFTSAVPLLGWIDLATNWLEKEKGASATYRVLSSTMQRAVVEAPSGGQHIVEMDARTCTCLEFQDRKLPCKHAIAVCKEHNLEPEDYVSIIYSVEEYRSTYQGALPPVIMDVPLSDTCLAPFLGQKKKGRNKKKRIRREELVRKAIKKVMRCSLCKSPHHNKRTCDGSGLPVELNPVDSDASSEEDEEDEEDEDVEDVEDAEDAEEDAEEDKDGPLYTWKEFSDPIEFESANSPQQTKEKEREHVSNMQSPTPILSPYVLPFIPPKSPQWDQISSENEDASGGEAIDPDDEIARLEAEEEAAEEGRQDEERAQTFRRLNPATSNGKGKKSRSNGGRRLEEENSTCKSGMASTYYKQRQIFQRPRTLSPPWPLGKRRIFNPSPKSKLVTRTWQEAREIAQRLKIAEGVRGMEVAAVAEVTAVAGVAGPVEAPEEGEMDDSDVVEEATPVIIARRTRSGRLIAMTEKAQASEARESVGAVAVVTAATSRTRQRGESTLKSVSLPGKKRSRKNT